MPKRPGKWQTYDGERSWGMPPKDKVLDVKIKQRKFGKIFMEEVEVPGTRKAICKTDILGAVGFFMLGSKTYLSPDHFTVTHWRVAANVS